MGQLRPPVTNTKARYSAASQWAEKTLVSLAPAHALVSDLWSVGSVGLPRRRKQRELIAEALEARRREHVECGYERRRGACAATKEGLAEKPSAAARVGVGAVPTNV